MSDYSNGKIYGIWSKLKKVIIYVGQTPGTLEERFKQHKSARWARDKATRPLYEHMKEIGTDNFEIRLIEAYPCDSKKELEEKEAYWIKQHGGLGRLRAGTKNAPEQQGGNLFNIYMPGGKYCERGDDGTEERRVYDCEKRKAAYYRNQEKEQEQAKERMREKRTDQDFVDKDNARRRNNYANNKHGEKEKAAAQSAARNAATFTCEYCGETLKGGTKYRHLNEHKQGDKKVPPRCPKHPAKNKLDLDEEIVSN